MAEVNSRAALMTAEDLYAIPDDDKHYELVNGELRVSEPPGFWHGALQTQIAAALHTHVATHGLGVVVTESGFVLRRGPDIVRGPDIAFIRTDRVPPPDRMERFIEGAPDFVAEIVSPGDAAWEIAEKVDGYLAHGVRLVWMVYPRLRQVVVHTPDRLSRVLRGNETLEGGEVVPGFILSVGDLFGDLPNAAAPRA
ncbi:protein of unknown function DUF820 [Gemmatirosa kalamazoonensis]|uniref:Putative restriction endonuclease domain-containing protein n=1 Tax=Gemmatirosa kalamazoonensis TaxID=861299 RepID=W0RET8_9BACT|nr:Uma2 family endonuclease [Gemmatirosa kalamazoonensis]AHG89619.1 protein of unknown function DUF820 [Gemmatirosa kalamazoonensis]